MGHVIQRFGINISRAGLILVIILAVLIGAMVSIGPLRPLPAEVQVVALDGSQAAASVMAQQERDSTTGRVRFGFRLALRNVGARPARPERLLLSVPAHYQLATHEGPLVGEVTPGVPLRRYAVELPREPLPADSTLRTVSAEPFWLEPYLPSYYCSTQSGQIPEFLPAPARNPELLSDVRIYYSVRTRSAQERHGGLLDLRVDPAALRSEPAPMPPIYPTTFREPGVDAPRLTNPRFAGARSSYCGDFEQSTELYTTTWQSAEGGRMFVLHVRGAPRKHLYDLDRDSVIELETWDVDGDGQFDSRRPARFRVPEFLVPLPEPTLPTVALDTVMPYDEWLGLFRDAALGPRRFAQAANALEARNDSIAAALAAAAAADSMAAVARADSAAAAARADSMNARPDSIRPATEELAAENAARLNPLRTLMPRDTAGLPRPTRAFITLFRETSAGPFRFSRQAAIDSARARAAADSASAARRRERRTVPLGVPIPYTRPDTLRP